MEEKVQWLIYYVKNCINVIPTKALVRPPQTTPYAWSIGVALWR